MQRALSLHALIVNQRTEGSEFILSCIAYGSSDINFTWYKDGVKINFNGTNRETMLALLAWPEPAERTLLELSPGREVWVDLYPAGSVLKLYNVQKSSEFWCEVSSVAGTNAKGVTMWALGSKDEACQAGASHGIRWVKTASGAHASAFCPPGHTGESPRFCEPRTTNHGVQWILPDFSNCVADSLRNIYEPKIYELQNVVAETAIIKAHVDIINEEFLIQSKLVREDNTSHFNFSVNLGTYEWVLLSAAVELVGRTGPESASTVVVQYHNLTSRLLSLKRSLW